VEVWFKVEMSEPDSVIKTAQWTAESYSHVLADLGPAAYQVIHADVGYPITGKVIARYT